MPEKKTTAKAREAKRKGKAASTQAGAFVGEEMEHYKEGKHGSRVKSRKQAIAIGLSKARRAGVKLKPPPKKGQASAATRKKAERDVAKGQRTARAKTKTSARRTSTAKKKSGPASKTSRSSSSRRSAERHRAR